MLKKERASTLGDPVRGVTTPFVRSFDTALPPEPSPSSASTQTRIKQSPVSGARGPKAETSDHLNFFLSKSELESGIARSKWLTQPLPNKKKSDGLNSEESRPKESTNSEFDNEISFEISNILVDRPDHAGAAGQLQDYASNSTPEQRQKKMKQDHKTAEEALRRISSLSLGSSKDRLRVNMERCIEVFGRHNTDKSLPPKPEAVAAINNPVEKDPRIGPDTGSSEVQIAILTAKIRALAEGLELRGGPDKVNKRNLRLLVHRRAKLLKYLRRKERGGPRWQNIIDTLGLTDGTWKGEISM